MTLIEYPPTESRFLLYTDWTGYSKILDALEDTRVRVTYDRGKLELMSPSKKHERVRNLLGRMLDALLQHLDVDFEMGGSMTFRREDLDRGLEPDECYWIAHYKQVEGKNQFDPTQDPPPDLVIEVDITSSSIDRIDLYRSMGVPEVWHYTRQGALRVLRLTDNGYEVSDSSRAVPQADMQVLRQHLDMGDKTGLSKVLRSFRQWMSAK